MREIKFKAFLRCNQRLANGITLGYEKFPKGIYEVMDLNFANEIATLWSEKEQTSFEVSFRKIELMQYTGVNDKNGHEIYEGDIIEFVSRLDDSKRIGTVRYWAGDAAFLIECEREIFFLFHDALNREVIGNIYENPEILKDRRWGRG